MDITTFGGPVPQRGIGVVAPFDFALDRELWRWTPDEVSLHLTRTPYVPVEVSVDMARLISEHETLQSAVTALDAVRPLSFAYACTSGSFVGGTAHERAMRSSMSRAGRDMPAVTTSGALLEALLELGARRVSVITPYTSSLTDALADFLAEGGVEVVGRQYMGLTGEIWKVGYRDVVDLARTADLSRADCLFISCTNLATYDVIPQLEAELRIPVISANQVTMWAALRRIGLRATGDYQSLIDQAAREALGPYLRNRSLPLPPAEPLGPADSRELAAPEVTAPELAASELAPCESPLPEPPPTAPPSTPPTVQPTVQPDEPGSAPDPNWPEH